MMEMIGFTADMNPEIWQKFNIPNTNLGNSFFLFFRMGKIKKEKVSQNHGKNKGDNP